MSNPPTSIWVPQPLYPTPTWFRASSCPATSKGYLLLKSYPPATCEDDFCLVGISSTKNLGAIEEGRKNDSSEMDDTVRFCGCMHSLRLELEHHILQLLRTLNNPPAPCTQSAVYRSLILSIFPEMFRPFEIQRQPICLPRGHLTLNTMTLTVLHPLSHYSPSLTTKGRILIYNFSQYRSIHPNSYQNVLDGNNILYPMQSVHRVDMMRDIWRGAQHISTELTRQTELRSLGCEDLSRYSFATRHHAQAYNPVPPNSQVWTPLDSSSSSR